MVESTLGQAEKMLKDGTENFQNADNGHQQRWAARLWLAGALNYLHEHELPTLPAQQLMLALEGLEEGHSSPLFKMKEGNAVGGRERADAGLRAEALACVDAFVKAGWKVTKAIGFTASCFEPVLKLDEGALANLRKKVKSETAKKKPQRYKALIATYNSVMLDFQERVDSGWPDDLEINCDPHCKVNKLWEGVALQRISMLTEFMNIEN